MMIGGGVCREGRGSGFHTGNQSQIESYGAAILEAKWM